MCGWSFDFFFPSPDLSQLSLKEQKDEQNNTEETVEGVL